ncbi:hypothetical protein BC829DRAFT_487440 [Chytridium lagenaria]|nr:hypothetical protein BC829DRAFT_487440 [Chytridium lagenaria]
MVLVKPRIEVGRDPMEYRDLESASAKRVEIWDQEVDAIDEGDDAAAWLSFGDGFPFLITTESSIRDLNSRLTPTAHTIQTLNFRSNISIDGPSLPAFNEETWKVISIHPPSSPKIPFYISSRCTRCPVPGNDLETGVLKREPMITMMGEVGVRVALGDAVEVEEFTVEHNRKVGIWRKGVI